MIFGGYSKGKEELPRVFQISIARFSRELPGPGEPLSLLVAIHEEGTGITWQQNITVEPDTERYFLDTTETLYRRGLGYGGGTPESALAAADELGRRLWATFLGDAGAAYLADSRPTALLLDVDETTLNLPWELMAWNGDPLALEFPFGRIVRTRARPRPGRDPLQEDAEARILAIANPTTDLAAAEREVAAIPRWRRPRQVQNRGGRAGVRRRDPGELPGAADPRRLRHRPLRRPCRVRPDRARSQRAAPGGRVRDRRRAIGAGLEGAALPGLQQRMRKRPRGRRRSAGIRSRPGQRAGRRVSGLRRGGYAGYFWPVTDEGSCRFTETFYPALFGWKTSDSRSRRPARVRYGSGPGRRPVRVQRRAVRRRGIGQASRPRNGRVSDNPSRLRRQLPESQYTGPKYLNGRVVATSAVSLRWQH